MKATEMLKDAMIEAIGVRYITVGAGYQLMGRVFKNMPKEKAEAIINACEEEKALHQDSINYFRKCIEQ